MENVSTSASTHTQRTRRQPSNAHAEGDPRSRLTKVTRSNVRSILLDVSRLCTSLQVPGDDSDYMPPTTMRDLLNDLKQYGIATKEGTAQDAYAALLHTASTLVFLIEIEGRHAGVEYDRKRTINVITKGAPGYVPAELLGPDTNVEAIEQGRTIKKQRQRRAKKVSDDQLALLDLPA